MSAVVRPLIAIKAGRCNPDPSNPKRIIPSPEPGLLYLYHNPEDDILHFCWKPRGSNGPPVDDLLMFAEDATFVPYPSKTGRVFMLKFSSSSERHFFWLQSKSEKADDPGFLSNRDKEWGRRINRLLQREEDDDGDEDLLGDDEDETMEDVERRDEGAEAREGGADGGRAPTSTISQPSPSNPTSAPTTAIPQTLPGTAPSQADFLSSLISSINIPPASASTAPKSKGVPLLLTDLLTPPHTIPILSSISSFQLQNLKSLLPSTIFPQNSTPEQDKEIIRRVLHSPQFSQGVAGLTTALRDEGGCKGVCESLGVDLNVVIKTVRGNGGDLVGGYVEGVRVQVEKEEKERKEGEEHGDDKMEE